MTTTAAYYVGADPQAVWEAAGATALLVAGSGTAGYATRRDPSALGRALFWALLALIVFGVALVFVQIPGGALIYAAAGLAIFAGLILFDFPGCAAPRTSAPLHPRRVDLPRRPERIPPVPVDLQRRRRLAVEAIAKECGPV